jgi:hypothetical protein
VTSIGVIVGKRVEVLKIVAVMLGVIVAVAGTMVTCLVRVAATSVCKASKDASSVSVLVVLVQELKKQQVNSIIPIAYLFIVFSIIPLFNERPGNSFIIGTENRWI